ncbi:MULTISPECIES: DUF485 domain-containing protein [Kocuria]|jgi:uncharacterized membrane protein (DUF485 family)|uniref:DUF485 domain-containing protein n=1 Tax=Kocuria TaxID=57493 RepID=UPI000380FBE6|nr:MULTISPECIES: DUF485 domain-containing protein [Kocuria]MCC5782187.1 DUF485 domain-containing protein [Kocuria sp. CCUG 69068]EYT48879.1 membrane protein [Kocuria sp. UCD-OTCP]MCM3486414.1 DUF485 domain-containing protein [Kocuria rosea]MEB2527510.1 DUF485 domain-containing protein [Kocuria rosea]MEB2617278.1 DUF485 domain-containing protein [Kocuria rosea]
MSTQPPIDADDLVADIDFPAAQRSPEFQELRKTHRGFVFPLAVAFLVWYLLYVVLAMYAPQLFAIQVIGNVNLGVVLGLLQFVTTFAITGAYVSFANRKLDPKATAIRERLEPSLGTTGGVHGQEN